MIFVAAGTHHQPFNRLIEAAERIAVELGEHVIVQRGASTASAPHTELYDVIAPDRFERLLEEARIIVLHAGSSSFLQARALGRKPIVVARSPLWGEHVDEHQLAFARALSPEEALVVEPEALLDAVRSHTEPSARTPREDRSISFCARFGPLVDSLVRRRER